MSKKLKNLFALICAAAICAGSLGLFASAEEYMDEAVEKAESHCIERTNISEAAFLWTTCPTSRC